MPLTVVNRVHVECFGGSRVENFTFSLDSYAFSILN